VEIDDDLTGLPSLRSFSTASRYWLLAPSLLGLVACSSPPSSSPGTTVPVILKDYRILASITTIPAGVVSFQIHSRGPSTHEFVIFETTQAADRMPLGTDGLTIDEDSPLLRPAGELSQVDIGASDQLVLRLPVGRYVLVCNMEGHYLGGMYLSLVVT
jgi:hypothetical protein